VNARLLQALCRAAAARRPAALKAGDAKGGMELGPAPDGGGRAADQVGGLPVTEASVAEGAESAKA